jgi:tRNA (guanine-N7-)-methyltransferase
MHRLASRYLVAVPHGELETSVSPQARVDWKTEFGRAVGPDTSELLVEIGSGTGDALVASALANPQASLVAFEVYERAVASTMSKLAAAQVNNVRILMVDGVQGLQVLFEPATITRLTTFFPDPWHKKRHHKRRLIQPAFAELVTNRLVADGRWLLATDWADYAEHMRAVLDVAPGLVNEHQGQAGWAPRPASRPITRFEQRGIDAGRRVFDLSYRRQA